MAIPRSPQKRLLRLISARADTDYASEAFQAFQAAHATPIAYHLFLSMVVCYCRPFTESRGIGSLLCEYPDYPDFPDADMNVRHQRMIDIRNNFLGHSSIEGSEVFLLAPGSQHPGTGETCSHFNYAVAKRHFLHPEYAPWLHQVVEALSARLDDDLRTVTKEIGEAYLRDGGTYKLDTGTDKFTWTSKKGA
jgi:hypothetical protein